MESTKTRYHLDNNYFSDPLKLGATSVIQIGRRYCDEGEIIQAHPHIKWFELTVITAGAATVSANGEDTAVGAGDIYLSFPYEVHEIRADRGARLEYDFLSFYPDDEELSRRLKEITRAPRSGGGRIISDERISMLVQSAISELTLNERSRSDEVLTNLFHLITIYTIRNFEESAKEKNGVSDAQILCYRIMNYIDSHIYSLRCLDDVAKKLGYSYGYLSAIFRKTTGQTASDYYRKRKLETAKALILENRKTISDIAEMLGYSLYSFSKAFKAAYGISPKAFQISSLSGSRI